MRPKIAVHAHNSAAQHEEAVRSALSASEQELSAGALQGSIRLLEYEIFTRGLEDQRLRNKLNHLYTALASPYKAAPLLRWYLGASWVILLLVWIVPLLVLIPLSDAVRFAENSVRENSMGQWDAVWLVPAVCLLALGYISAGLWLWRFFYLRLLMRLDNLSLALAFYKLPRWIALSAIEWLREELRRHRARTPG